MTRVWVVHYFDVVGNCAIRIFADEAAANAWMKTRAGHTWVDPETVHYDEE